jgi:DNA-directed RNA polymerase II subunit RPB11
MVKFAGYKHPHPLENDILVKVQTAPGAAPTEALQRAAGRIESELRLLQTEYRSQLQAIQKQQEEIGGGMI